MRPIVASRTVSITAIVTAEISRARFSFSLPTSIREQREPGAAVTQANLAPTGPKGTQIGQRPEGRRITAKKIARKKQWG
jgi:hypothetical protein